MKIHNDTKTYKILKSYIDFHSAFTAIDLKSEIGNKANKSTVYRILSRLLKRGIIHQFTDDKGTIWYAKCKKCSSEDHFDDHPHFKCIHCGKIECADDIKIKLPKSSMRSLMSQSIFLKGKCENCCSQLNLGCNPTNPE